MARKSIGLLIGLLVLGAVVMTLQQVAAIFHPLPPGLEPMNPDHAEAFTEHLAAMPTAAAVVGFLSAIRGAACGAVAAGRTGRRPRALPGVVVALALAGSIVNWTSFAHPTWFVVGQLVAYPAVLFGVVKLLEAKLPRPAQPV